MKKIFKKSLALAVSAALCLTALFGCLTVSAAGTATASISTANVANGSTSATITVTIGSADDQVAAARFNLVVPTGITLDTSAFDSTITNGNGYTDTVNGFTVISNDNMFLLEAENEVVKGGSASFDIPVTIADGTTAATYAVSFGDVLEVANYGTYDSTTGTWSNDEALLTVSSTNGGVTVAEAAATEPVEIALSDGNIAPKNMYYDSFVGQRIRVNYNANARSVLQRGYTDYKIEIAYQAYNGSYMLEDKVLTFNSSDRDMSLSTANVHYFTFSEPALYEMGLEYTTTVKLYDGEDYVAYQSETTSISAQALAELQNKLAANQMNTVKALVDLVNFGAAAQTYFANGRPTSDIANAALPNVGFEAYQTYASTNADLPEAFNLTRTKDAQTANGVNATWPSVKVEAACSIAFNYKAGTYTADQLKTVASYDGAYGTVSVETPFTAMNYTGTLYNYVFNGLALYDMSATINFTVKAGEVTEYTSAYSTGYYLNETIASSDPLLSDYGLKLAVFSQSIRVALVGA